MSLYDWVSTQMGAMHAGPNSPSVMVTHVKGSDGTQTPNIPARVDRDMQSEPSFDDGRMKTRMGQLTIRVADLATVSLEDSFLIVPVGGGAGEEWKVTGIPLETPAFREIAVSRTGNRRWATAATEHERGRSDGQARRAS
jgi:hypothetical protein